MAALGGIRLTWAVNTIGNEGQYVYRSTSPMDPGSLPAPFADLGPGVNEYEDTGATQGQCYYYRVAAYEGQNLAVSDEIKVYNDTFVYVSPQSSGDLGWSDGSGYNDTQGESTPCSGLMSFDEAVEYANLQGGRLPTLEEVVNGAIAGTGCGYDGELIWTCDKGADAAEHYIARGEDGANEAIFANNQTAYVRFVADNDIDRPDALVLNDAAIGAVLFC